MLYIILMHIFAVFFFFFANELLFAVYFICLLEYGDDVIQKANWNDFIIGV